MLSPEAFQAVTAPVDDALGLPNDCYTSAAFLQRENAELLPASWIGITFDDDVAEPGDLFPVQAAGGTMMTYELTKQLGRDVPLFFGGGIAVIGAFLIILFRRVSAMLLCVAVVVPATLATFGLASLFRLPFSAPVGAPSRNATCPEMIVAL